MMHVLLGIYHSNPGPPTDYRTYIGMAAAAVVFAGMVVVAFKVRDDGVRGLIQLGLGIGLVIFAVLLWFVFPAMPIQHP